MQLPSLKNIEKLHQTIMVTLLLLKLLLVLLMLLKLLLQYQQTIALSQCCGMKFSGYLPHCHYCCWYYCNHCSYYCCCCKDVHSPQQLIDTAEH